MISFVCGYCAGYYFYDLIRPKNFTEDIVQFFSSYNKKYGFVSSYAKKIDYKRWFVFRRRLIQRKWIFGKIKKKKRKKEEVVTSSKCSFYFGKRIMTLSVELATTPTEEIDIIKNIF